MPVPMTQEELKEARDHQNVILALREILGNDSGKRFIKYLFKELCVADPIPKHLDENDLREYLGIHRAGNSIFKIVSEADHGIAGALLGIIEKERYDEIYKVSSTERS